MVANGNLPDARAQVNAKPLTWCATEEILKTIGLFVYLYLCFVCRDHVIAIEQIIIINGQSSGQCRSNNKTILIQFFAHKPCTKFTFAAVHCNKMWVNITCIRAMDILERCTIKRLPHHAPPLHDWCAQQHLVQ